MNETEIPESDEGAFHGFFALIRRDIRKWYLRWEAALASVLFPLILLVAIGNMMNFWSFFERVAVAKFGLPATTASIAVNQLMISLFGTNDYFTYISLGMLSFVILISAIIGGMSLSSDRRHGFLMKALITPVYRPTIMFAKVFSTAIISTAQAAIALIIAILLGVHLKFVTSLGLLETFVALFLMSFGLSSFFLLLAIRSSHWENQVIAMNLFDIPLIFANNAYYPMALMPTWLQYVVRLNPLSYGIDVSRQLLLGSPAMSSLPVDFLVLLLFAVGLSVIGVVLSLKLLTQ